MALYDWLENTPIGHWVRDSLWGFPINLIVHAWAMGFVVGISLLLALSVLGVTPRLLQPLLDKFLPFTWITFTLSFLSGFALLSTYPARVLNNEVFYLKMFFIVVALTLAVSLKRKCSVLSWPQQAALPMALKLRAVGILLAWFGTIVAGRLLYYTSSALPGN